MLWETNSTILRKLHDYGARTVWTDLEASFHRPLSRLAERSGLSHDQAQDLVQDTLLAFAQSYRAGKYDAGKAKLRNWLFGIARVLIRRARANLARDRVDAFDLSDLDAEQALADEHAPELERVWEEEWRRSIVDRALGLVHAEVNEQTFEVFRLRTVDGLSSQEVAARLSIPIGRVYNAHSRVLQRIEALRATLDDA